jgi:hypothetical protein
MQQGVLCVKVQDIGGDLLGSKLRNEKVKPNNENVETPLKIGKLDNENVETPLIFTRLSHKVTAMES